MMRKISLVLALLIGCVIVGLAQPVGYNFLKKIEIDHSVVSGTADLIDYPFLLKITDNDLSHIAEGSGGKIENGFCYDIVFTLEDQTTILDFDIIDYDPAAGSLIAWVKIPVLSASANTMINLYFGNNSVTTDPSSGATWSSDYLAVYQMDYTNDDATTNARHITTFTGTSNSSGKVNIGKGFNGTSDYMVTPVSDFKTLDNFSFGLWFKTDNTDHARHIIWQGNKGNGFGSGNNPGDNEHEMHLNFGNINSAGSSVSDVLNFFIGNTDDSNSSDIISIQHNFNNTTDWTYVVVNMENMNSTPSAEMFVNGASVGTDTGALIGAGTYGIDRTQWLHPLQLGGPEAIASYYDGTLDVVELLNTVQSSDLIQTKFNNIDDPASFTTVYPMINVSPPSHLYVHSRDESNELHWTASDNTSATYNIYRSVEPDSAAFGATPIATVPAGTTTYTDNSLDNNTFYFYYIKAVESSTESSPTNVDASTPQSSISSFINFDGVDDYLSINDSSDFLLQPQMTLEFWFRTEKNSGQQYILDRVSRTTNTHPYNLLINSDELLYRRAGDNTYYQISTIDKDTWYHLSITSDNASGGVINFYLNGILATPSPIPSKPFNRFESTYSPGVLAIGAQVSSPSLTYSSHFDGQISELRMWDKILTPAEITNNMNIPLKGDETDIRALFHLDDIYNTTVYNYTSVLRNAVAVGNPTIHNPHVTANDDSETIQEDVATEFDVKNNDTFSNATQKPKVKVEIVTAPTHGTAEVLSNYKISYTPDADYFGTDVIEYLIVDTTAIGDIYQFEDKAFVNISITPVNDIPSFTAGANQTVTEDAGAQTETGWATGLSTGPSNESGQTLSFNVSNTNTPLFSTQPAIAPDGTLTYTPANNANGTATVNVTLEDSGGVLNGGVNTSVTIPFTITVSSVNDHPISANNAVSVDEDNTYTFTNADFAFTDTDGDNYESFMLTSLPASGILKYNGSAAATYTHYTNRSLLTFEPTADENGSPYTTFEFQVKDDGGNAPNISSGLVGYYTFDGDTDDLSGNGHHGTGNGGLSYTTGVNGYGIAASFDGIDDYISLGAQSNFFAGDPFSVSAWVKSSNGDMGIIGTLGDVGDITPGEDGWVLSLRNNLQTWFSTEGNSVLNQRTTAAHNYSAASTNHIAFVMDASGTGNIYINGVKGTTDLAFPLSFDDAMDLMIGASASSPSSNFFNGSMDNISIYERDLRSAEISALYNHSVNHNYSSNYTMTVNVNPINDAPSDISLSSTSVDENLASGTTFATLSTTDPDTGDTHTYTLVSGAGDTDNASFQISGSDLLTNTVYDFETKSSYSIRVETSDGALSYEEIITITINDIDESGYFITTWQTTTNGESITIPTESGETYNYTVNWGDGAQDTGVTGDATHSYANAGIYTVSITGDFPQIYFDNNGDKNKILTVEQWGDIEWTSMRNAFSGCSLLRVPATDAPDLSQVTSFSQMFYNASVFNDPINHWDVSTITSMEGMFRGATSFDQPLDSWDVRNVMVMVSMFRSASSFDQPLNSWVVESTTNMSAMFRQATSFDQPLDNWDVSKVTDMSHMFRQMGFNQDITGWVVDKVTTMANMFERNGAFNQDIGSWDVSKVTNMGNMFFVASAFDQSLGGWVLNPGVNIPLNTFAASGMSCESYSASLQGWAANTSSPNNISVGMYELGYGSHAIAARSKLTTPVVDGGLGWTISADELLTGSNDCTPVGSKPFVTTWKTDNTGDSDDDQITIPTNGGGYNYYVHWVDESDPSSNATIGPFTGDTTIDFPAAGTYQVTVSGDFPQIYFNNTGDKDKILTVEQWGDNQWSSMESAFWGCSNLHVPATDAPDLSSVTSLFGMFKSASVFNEPINHWVVDNVNNMEGMFQSARDFNQPLNNWNVDNVLDMSAMFAYADHFNQSLNGWIVDNVEEMGGMFSNTHDFDQPLNNWNVNNVEQIGGMFASAESFNQDIQDWELDNVISMALMFQGAITFNQPLNGWDVSNVTNMDRMFQNAAAFNQYLGSWTSEATVRDDMFDGSGMDCINYTGTLIGWTTNTTATNVNMGSNGLEYGTNAASAVNELETNRSWDFDDHTASSSECLLFNITNILDANIDENDPYVSVGATIASGTPIGTLTYTLSGVDAAAFTIDDPAIGVVRMIARDFEGPLDNDTDNIYEVIIRATDEDGNFDEEDWVVEINNLNDNLPIADNESVTTAEEVNYTFSASDFNNDYSDADNNTFAGIRITSLPSAGVLEDNGTTLLAADVAAPGYVIADITKVIFVPEADESGSPYTSFDFDVYDGTFYSASSYTMTINVTPYVPSASLTVDNSTIAENAGVATFTVALDKSSSRDVTISLSYSGTATGSSSDYTAAVGTNATSITEIVIPSGSTTGTVKITAVDDSIDENDESVIVDILSVTNGTENGVQQVTTTITDDDAAGFTLSKTTATTTEA
ncbi:surface protein, partial [Reichenbachiella agariperforans]